MGCAFSHFLWRKFNDYPANNHRIGRPKALAADGHRFLGLLDHRLAHISRFVQRSGATLLTLLWNHGAPGRSGDGGLSPAASPPLGTHPVYRHLNPREPEKRYGENRSGR